MSRIRPATSGDLSRIAEILVFNYRLYFYPIFLSDEFYFGDLTVENMAAELADSLAQLWVYDDSVVKGFTQIGPGEVKRLFVEPALQGRSIGAELLRFAVEEKNARFLWALEKNTRAIRFYQRHGFHLTDDRKLEEDTTEYLIRLER